MKNTFKFLEWLNVKNEVTLYHGTIIDNEKSILSHGLMPDVGNFTKNAYGVTDGDYSNNDHAVYLTNKMDLEKATTAMVNSISHKLGKSNNEVTDEDIIQYGLLCVVEDPDNHLTQKTDDDNAHPRFAEPNDYYSRDVLKPNRILKGSALIRFLKIYHVWPITWSLKKLSNTEDNYLRGKLTANAIKRHPEKSVEEIRNKVSSLNQTNAEAMFKQYFRKN